MFKKIFLFMFILLILSSLNLFANEDLFKGFQLSYVVLDGLDIISTLYGIEKSERIVEINPLVKWYIKSPLLTLSVHFVLDIVFIKFTDLLFKKNKTLAWFVIIGVNLAKGYVVYRNFRIISNL